MRGILVASTVLAAVSTAAFAGGMAEPVMEPEVVVEDTGNTSGGWLVPILLLVLIAVAASNSGGSDTPVQPPA